MDWYQFIRGRHPNGDMLKIKAFNYNEALRSSVTCPVQQSEGTFLERVCRNELPSCLLFKTESSFFPLQDFHIHTLSLLSRSQILAALCSYSQPVWMDNIWKCAHSVHPRLRNNGFCPWLQQRGLPIMLFCFSGNKIIWGYVFFMFLNWLCLNNILQNQKMVNKDLEMCVNISDLVVSLCTLCLRMQFPLFLHTSRNKEGCGSLREAGTQRKRERRQGKENMMNVCRYNRRRGDMKR